MSSPVVRWLTRLVAVAGTASIGCGPPQDPGPNPCVPEVGSPAGATTQYVASTLLLPTSPSEAQEFGVNVDCDPQERPDNAFGSFVAALSTVGVDVAAATKQAVSDGDIVLLQDVQADDFVNWPDAGWRLYRGEPQSMPSFSGTGFFTIAADSTEMRTTGTIAGGRYEGAGTNVVLEISLGAGTTPLELALISARIEADVTATGASNAKLGGAMDMKDIQSRVLAKMALIMNQSVVADTGCAMDPPMCGTVAQGFLDLFDTGVPCTDDAQCPAGADKCGIPAGMSEGTCSCGAAECGGQLANDLTVTFEELEKNDLTASLLAPDVDMLNEFDELRPGEDGVKDSLSVGFGFEMVNATF